MSGAVRCAECGVSNRAGARFCDVCGRSVLHDEPSTALRVVRPDDRPGLGVGDLSWENPGDGSLLIFMPGGASEMGSDFLSAAERPPHRVLLHSFWIARQPATNAQFRRFIERTGHQPAYDWEGHLRRRGATVEGTWERFARLWGEDAPVVGVSRADAEAYCRWAHLRLPSEAEWECAACSAPFDDEPMAWVDDALVPCQLLDPGQELPPDHADLASWTFMSNGVEMAWNVLEWCSTRYAPYPYDPEDGREDPQRRGRRVLRGGMWTCRDVPLHRELLRIRRPAAGDLLGYVGFRCAMDDPWRGCKSLG